jgi:hypothetical protein
MLKCSAFSAAAAFGISVAIACASKQPAPSPPAPEPAPVNLPPAQIESTSSSPQQAAESSEVKPDSSLNKDAGTGISDMDAAATAAPASGGACKTDADCVPAQCCHATSCVAKGAAPDCKATMCTKECRGGTLDCGGGCFCQQGKCNARLGKP